MLNKSQLMRKKEVGLVAKKGKYISSTSNYSLKFLSSQEVSSPKFAISINKKVEKLAVGRNKYRRLIKHGLFELLKEEAFKEGFYLIVVKSPQTPEASADSIKQELSKLMRTAQKHG